MNGNWDQQLKEFLRRTGDELRKAGEDLKGEAQRLLVEVKDPDRQQRVRENLEELRTWAQKTANEAATRFEGAVKRVETVVEEAVATVQTPGSRKKAASKAKAATPAAGKAEAPKAKAPAKAAKKTVGKKRAPAAAPSTTVAGTTRQTAGKKKSPVPPKTATGAKKTIGKRKKA